MKTKKIINENRDYCYKILKSNIDFKQTYEKMFKIRHVDLY